MPTLNRAMPLATPSLTVAFQNRTVTLTSTGIDFKDYDGSVRFILGGTRQSGDLAPALEMSDTVGGVYEAVPAIAITVPANAVGWTPVTTGASIFRVIDVDVSQCRAFIRFVGTASNTPDHTYGVMAMGFKKQT